MDNVVLTVYNNHIASCGSPPNLETSSQWFTAYFENQEHEQLVFRYDRLEKKSWLWHGDLSWRQPVPVVDGTCPHLILSQEERLWLQLVWTVATR